MTLIKIDNTNLKPLLDSFDFNQGNIQKRIYIKLTQYYYNIITSEDCINIKIVNSNSIINWEIAKRLTDYFIAHHGVFDCVPSKEIYTVDFNTGKKATLNISTDTEINNKIDNIIKHLNFVIYNGYLLVFNSFYIMLSECYKFSDNEYDNYTIIQSFSDKLTDRFFNEFKNN